MRQNLFLSVLFTLLPLGVWAEIYQDPETKVNYEYTLGNSEASVAYSSDACGDISILETFTVDGNVYFVLSIGNRAF